MGVGPGFHDGVHLRLNSGMPMPLAPDGAASQSNQLPPVADFKSI
jgi:hypothetical protein